MAHMDPDNGKKFRLGNTTSPGEVDPDFDFVAKAADDSIVAILTVDKYGGISTWNHPLCTEKLKNSTNQVPYLMSQLHDLVSVNFAIYSETGNPRSIELGIWNPGPPRKMVS